MKERNRLWDLGIDGRAWTWRLWLRMEVVGCCEIGNEHSRSIRRGEFLDYLRNCQFFQEGLCSMELFLNENIWSSRKKLKTAKNFTWGNRRHGRPRNVWQRNEFLRWVQKCSTNQANVALNLCKRVQKIPVQITVSVSVIFPKFFSRSLHLKVNSRLIRT
jgi:hypothetical protein